MSEVIVFNLKKARDELLRLNMPASIINAPGSIRYISVLSIHKIFEILNKEFTIIKTTLLVDDDLLGLFEGIKLGYKNIIYTGNSYQAKKLLKDNNINVF